MKAKIAKLIDVKSLITLCLTGVFCYLCIVGKLSGENFMIIFSAAITYFFGKENGKAAQDKPQDPAKEELQND